LFGLDEIASGDVVRSPDAYVRTHGRRRPRYGCSPRCRIADGFGLVSEDRKTEGLAQSRSIADNMTLSRLKPYSRFGWLNLRRRRHTVADWMRRLHVKAASPEQTVSELSGGNQQKVAIARVLHQQADILLLDEPTRGIDVATKAEIYRLMGEQAAAGKAIVFVSSYVTELLAVCDRVAVMSRGNLKEVRAAKDWTEESVMAVAVSV
jgi:ribose transport system ATP-binding protein